MLFLSIKYLYLYIDRHLDEQSSPICFIIEHTSNWFSTQFAKYLEKNFRINEIIFNHVIVVDIVKCFVVYYILLALYIQQTSFKILKLVKQQNNKNIYWKEKETHNYSLWLLFASKMY